VASLTVRDVLDACRSEASTAATHARAARQFWREAETHRGKAAEWAGLDALYHESHAADARERAARFARLLPRTWRRLLREGLA